MKEHYERLYKESKLHFGKNPSPLALLLIQHCRNGKILDLGCGQGRDALYFASKGLQVTGIDISPTGIQDLQEQTKRLGLEIDAQQGDMNDLPDGEFDAIFSNFALQMIEPSKRKQYVEKLKSTYPHALHAHVVPLSGACFSADFIFGDLLKEAYADWSTLFYEECWTLSPAPNRNGEPYLVREARIIAKR